MKYNNGSGDSRSLESPIAYPFHIEGREDVVFVHIPKTAGTSIRQTFKFNKVKKETGIKKHNDAVTIISLIGKEKWHDSFKFTFVRNPWDRLLSHYHYKLRKGVILKLNEQNSFKEWALNIIKEKSLNQRQTFNLQPQINWLKNQNGIVDLNFIGRFEHLNRDFLELSSKLSTSLDSLIHVNKNPVKLDYRDHYDSELKEKVGQFYQEDIEYFKYSY